MNLFGLVTSGTCFGLWPLIMQRSGFQGVHQSLSLTLPTSAVILTAWISGINGGWMVNTLLAASLFLGIAAAVEWIIIPPHAIGTIAGLINGLGTIKFLGILGSTPQKQVSTAILTVVLTQIVLNELGGVAFFGAAFSLRKAVGFAMAIGAAVLVVGGTK